MRLAMVCSAIDYEDAGAIPERAALEVQALIARGHSVHCYGAAFPGRTCRHQFQVDRIHPNVLPRPLATWSLWRSYGKRMTARFRHLLQNRFDGIIETEQYIPAKFYRQCQQAGVPVIAFLHCDRKSISASTSNPYNPFVSKLLDQNTDAALRYANGIVVLNERMAARVRQDPNYAGQPIGLSAGAYTGPVDPQPSAATSCVLFAGRLSPEKGPLQLLDAFAKARQAHPHLTLRMLGDGPLRQAVEARIAALHLSEAVTMEGAVPPSKVLAAMRSAAVTVLPSTSEQFGMAVVESMAQGCPVVATDTDGPSAIITHEHDGLLVPADGIAEAISRVISDRNLAERLAHNGLQRVKDFLPEAVLPPICSFYERCFGPT